MLLKIFMAFWILLLAVSVLGLLAFWFKRSFGSPSSSRDEGWMPFGLHEDSDVSGNIGKEGERNVARTLAAGLLQPDYYILNDIYITLCDKTTTQIDHVVASRYGVFVIETKTYSGWIFGDAKAAQWTQAIHRKGFRFCRKYRFQNPIRQNFKHKCALAQTLGISRDYFKDIVVFSDDCKFQTQMPPEVVNLRNLIRHIKSFTKPIIKDKDVSRIAIAISEWAATVDEDAKEKHVDNLRKSHSPVSINDSAPLCPYCGKTMVLRVNRKTKERFYGCPGYPECRGMKKIAQV